MAFLFVAIIKAMVNAPIARAAMTPRWMRFVTRAASMPQIIEAMSNTFTSTHMSLWERICIPVISSPEQPISGRKRIQITEADEPILAMTVKFILRKGLVKKFCNAMNRANTHGNQHRQPVYAGFKSKYCLLR